MMSLFLSRPLSWLFVLQVIESFIFIILYLALLHLIFLLHKRLLLKNEINEILILQIMILKSFNANNGLKFLYYK